MIICASVKVRGHHGDRYTAEWVNRLHSAMARHLPVPKEHVCFTDDAAGISPHIRTVDIGPWWREWSGYNRGMYHPIGGWWAKVKLFHSALWSPGDLVVYSDLDNLIVGPLKGIVDAAADSRTLTLLSDSAENKTPKRGVIRKFNSSFMVWEAGQYSGIYSRFGEAALKNFRSDQDWIAHLYPWARTIDPIRVQRLSTCLHNGPYSDTRIVLCIKPKNDEAAKQSVWVRESWR